MRKQWVAIDGITSGWVSVKSGVPQGMVLSPLMFLIYTVEPVNQDT